MLIHTTESASYPWQVVQTAWTGTQYSLPSEPGQPALPLKMWVDRRCGEDAARTRRDGISRSFARRPRRAGSRRSRSSIRPRRGCIRRWPESSRQTSIGVLPGHASRPGRRLHRTLRSLRHPRSEARRASRTPTGSTTAPSTTRAESRASLRHRQAFTPPQRQPGRSIYFVATTAEESGLLGAEYFVRHPPLAR